MICSANSGTVVLLLGRFDDEFVIDIGDVDDEGDLVAEIDEVAFDGVEDDRPDHVAEMARLVDGRPADVHADLAGLDRLEGFLWRVRVL